MTRRAVRGLVPLLAACFGLAAPAPSWCVTTINVEIDYMITGGHSHRPSSDEIAAVVQMFACHGITLNAVVDDAISEVTLMTDGPDPNDFFTATGPNTFRSMKDLFFDHVGQAGWHYCIFGHQYQEDGGTTGSSGLAEGPGDDLVVTLGTAVGQIGTPFDRAATFAHELGHNLGLQHAGSQDENVTGPFKPIYASIMSYMFQLTGVRSHLKCLGVTGSLNLFKDLDYSNGRLPNVDENALDEDLGAGMTPVDWDCNGSVGGVIAHDLNDPDNDGKWCDAAGSRQVLSDFNDWAVVLASLSAQPGPFAVEHHEPCVTAEVALRTSAASDCAGGSPTLVSESCVDGQIVFVDPAYGGPQTGAGSSPFNTFLNAYNGSPDHSEIYFRPGTYHSGAGVLSRPLTLTGPLGFSVVP